MNTRRRIVVLVLVLGTLLFGDPAAQAVEQPWAEMLAELSYEQLLELSDATLKELVEKAPPAISREEAAAMCAEGAPSEWDCESLLEEAQATASIPDEYRVEDFTIVEFEQVGDGDMVINWTNHAMKDRGDGTTFYEWAQSQYPDWPAVDPAKWPTAPNVPNPLVDWFRVVNGDEVPDGLEIPDTGERNFCQVREGEWCTTPIPPGHYALYTGDGFVPNLWDGTEDGGHAFSYWNVGNVEARLDGVFFQGWRLSGRYWNGDAMPYGIVALHSHAANNMLDLSSELNPRGMDFNAGGNCGNPSGCDEVQHTVVIASGNAPLAIVSFRTSK